MSISSLSLSQLLACCFHWPQNPYLLLGGRWELPCHVYALHIRWLFVVIGNFQFSHVLIMFHVGCVFFLGCEEVALWAFRSFSLSRSCHVTLGKSLFPTEPQETMIVFAKWALWIRSRVIINRFHFGFWLWGIGLAAWSTALRRIPRPHSDPHILEKGAVVKWHWRSEWGGHLLVTVGGVDRRCPLMDCEINLMSHN